MPLYIVSTPIGNLEDLSPRALRVLTQAAVVACEDTRHTGRMLNHFGLRKTTVRYDNHVHKREAPKLLERLRRGEDVALVSDAGTPGLSDPGSKLVEDAVRAGLPVVPVPGPSSVLALLAASGLPMDRFTFLGFLPRRPGRIKKEFQKAGADRTLVFLESVFRLRATLELARDVFGDVPAAVGRELTKMHEEFIRGSLGEIVRNLNARREIKGEAVVAVSPHAKETTGVPTEHSVKGRQTAPPPAPPRTAAGRVLPSTPRAEPVPSSNLFLKVGTVPLSKSGWDVAPMAVESRQERRS